MSKTQSQRPKNQEITMLNLHKDEMSHINICFRYNQK